MISINATFKWNDRTKIMLSQAPEKILRQIARQTLDFTGSTKVTAYTPPIISFSTLYRKSKEKSSGFPKL